MVYQFKLTKDLGSKVIATITKPKIEAAHKFIHERLQRMRQLPAEGLNAVKAPPPFDDIKQYIHVRSNV